MNRRFYEITDVFQEKLMLDNNRDLLRLQFLMYLFTCYSLVKEKKHYHMNFYELENFPISLEIEAKYKMNIRTENNLPVDILDDINDIYNNFGKLSNKEIYALILDNHYSNHFKIYNEKNTKPIKEEYMKNWFSSSFISHYQNYLIIDESKIEEKTNYITDFFKYEPNEITYKPKKPNPDYDTVIEYTKELLSLFKKEDIKTNKVKIQYLLYLSESYYMAYENKDFMFKQEFEVTEEGPVIPAINTLYQYIIDNLDSIEDTEYISKSYLTINHENHSPRTYIKKVYNLYKNKTVLELENILYQTNSPYTILNKYGKDKHYIIPKKMSKDWLKKNLNIIENINTKEQKKETNNIFKSITSLFKSKTPTIKKPYTFYEYSYQRYCKKERLKNLANSNDILLNASKKIISKFSSDNKHISLEHLNLLMYLIDGFYDKELFPYNFKVTESIPTTEILNYFTADYRKLNGNIIKPVAMVNYNLEPHINEYIDYMYNVFNDIPYEKLVRLCTSENTPAFIAKKYTKDKIVSKDMTRGWLKKEFSYTDKIEYDIIKTKIKNIK